MKEIEGCFKITMNVDDIVEMTDDITAILGRYAKGGKYSLKTLPVEGVK